MPYIYIPDTKTPEQIEQERKWEEEKAAQMYEEGQKAGATMYDGEPLRAWLYGYEHYLKLATIGPEFAYERGISDALADRINAYRREHMQ